MSVVKRLPYGYFYSDKEYALSSAMLMALKKTYLKQKGRTVFGPKDLKRSIYPLIERGLVSLTFYNKSGIKKPTWSVTGKGLQILKSAAGK